MKLLFAPTSPYVRKVMVCAHLTHQVDQIELLDSAAHPINRDDRIAAFNPVAKVPTLVLEDGRPLFDSRVICEYLASRAGDDTLFPAVGPKRWTALMQQALGDALLDAALLARYEVAARPAEVQWPAWRQAQLNKVEACLTSIESMAKDLAIDSPSIGEVTLGCALGYLDFRFPELEWRKGRPGATRWDEAFQRKAAMQATRPPAA